MESPDTVLKGDLGPRRNGRVQSEPRKAVALNLAQLSGDVLASLWYSVTQNLWCLLRFPPRPHERFRSYAVTNLVHFATAFSWKRVVLCYISWYFFRFEPDFYYLFNVPEIKNMLIYAQNTLNCRPFLRLPPESWHQNIFVYWNIFEMQEACALRYGMNRCALREPLTPHDALLW